MKVYLASSFSLRDRVEKVYQRLTNTGHEIEDIWWRDDRLRGQENLDSPWHEFFKQPEVQQMAQRHWDAIERADAYVLVAPEDEKRRFNGANIELGYAYAHGLDCYAVGTLKRSVMYAPVHRYGDIGSLVRGLKE